MKKLLALISLLVITVLIGTYSIQKVSALGFVFRSGIDVSTGQFAMQTNTATTTGTFIKNGTATTTFTFPSDTFSELSVFLLANFPTTNQNSYLNMEVLGSDDGIDFFTYDNTRQNQAIDPTIPTTTIRLASSSMPFAWRPTIKGATTSKLFSIELIPSRFTRVVITLNSTSSLVALPDTATFWVNFAGQIKTDR